MTGSGHTAINFLPFKATDFSYTVYRRRLAPGEVQPEGARSLPDCQADRETDNERSIYAIAFSPAVGFEEVSLHAWVNPDLTVDIIHRALQKRVGEQDLADKTETAPDDFYREVNFLLARHSAAREVMQLRAYALRSIGRFGFLCNFCLRVPPGSLTEKQRLELSLTHKNGRLNEDFYVDHYAKIAEFLRLYFGSMRTIELHDGQRIELENRLASVSSFTLSKRTYVFANHEEDKNQFFGLRDYGPFEAVPHVPRIVFVFQPADRPQSQDLFRALRGDTYSTFPGMEKMFRIGMDRNRVSGIEVPRFDPDELQKACDALAKQYPGERLLPIAIVPFSRDTTDPEETRNYVRAKHTFLSRRIVTQFVDRERMGNRNALKWSISNIALAIFAKMGGVPWRVKPSTEECLIVGIGQAHRKVAGKIEKYVAYSVLTDSSGVYETIRILGNSTNRKEYLESLKTNLAQVLLSHRSQYKSFVLHVTFTMKREEINAIRSLLQELETGDGAGSEFVAIKFNDRNDFFGFSPEHNSRVPYEGSVARLSKREFLIWFSGVNVSDSKAPKKPERPVHLRILYPDEPLSDDRLKRLLQDAMNIAGANWRGFNAKSIPISVYYAKLIADYYSEFRDADLSEIDMDNMSPWFL